MTPTIRPPHEDLMFLCPLSPERGQRLVNFLATDLTGRVLDSGCGWAELLLQVLAAAPDAQGVGVDIDAVSLEHGRELARRRGLADRATLLEENSRTAASRRADAVICIGSSQIWGPPAEDRLPLDYAAALAALRATVRRSARVVYGEGSGRVRRPRRRWRR